VILSEHERSATIDRVHALEGALSRCQHSQAWHEVADIDRELWPLRIRLLEHSQAVARERRS
jgi:hypothetical protein